MKPGTKVRSGHRLPCDAGTFRADLADHQAWTRSSKGTSLSASSIRSCVSPCCNTRPSSTWSNTLPSRASICLITRKCPAVLSCLTLHLCRQELFYQLGLRQFGRFSRINLTPPPSLEKLVRLAVDRAHADGTADDNVVAKSDAIVQVSRRETRGGAETEAVLNWPILFVFLSSRGAGSQRVVTTLIDAAPMLEEYFSFTITANKELASLPLVLPGHAPDITKLPLCAFFRLRLRELELDQLKTISFADKPPTYSPPPPRRQRRLGERETVLCFLLARTRLFLLALPFSRRCRTASAGQQTRPRLGSDRAGSTTHDRARTLPRGEAVPRRAGETAREGRCARHESRGAVSGV